MFPPNFCTKIAVHCSFKIAGLLPFQASLSCSACCAYFPQSACLAVGFECEVLGRGLAALRSRQGRRSGRRIQGSKPFCILVQNLGPPVSAKHFPVYTCTKHSWSRQPGSFCIKPGIAKMHAAMQWMSICQLDTN